MALQVQKDRFVTLVYRIVDGDGRVLEEKTPDAPYEYVHGHGQINDAIERAIEGKTPGYQIEVHLTPREGYGEYHQSLVADLPRAGFPADLDIQAGMKFNTTGPAGEPLVVRVIDADDETVTVDGNHPLAGLELVFDLKIIDVRESTVEETTMAEAKSRAPKQGSESIH